jgi:hypothetical protein
MMPHSLLKDAKDRCDMKSPDERPEAATAARWWTAQIRAASIAGIRESDIYEFKRQITRRLSERVVFNEEWYAEEYPSEGITTQNTAVTVDPVLLLAAEKSLRTVRLQPGMLPDDSRTVTYPNKVVVRAHGVERVIRVRRR